MNDSKTIKGSPAMVVAGTFAYLFMGAMYVWSVIRLELVKLYPALTAAQLSLVFTLMMSFFCMGGFCGGKITERKDPGFSLRLAAILIMIGYMGASTMEFFSENAVLPLLYIFLSAFAGFGIGIGYNACMANISPWFPSHVGFVSGILLMGFGVSSLIFGFLIEAVCPTVGLNNIFRFFGISIPVILTAASFFIKKPESAKKPAVVHGDGGKDCTPREMIARPSFWIYFLWNSIMGATGLLVINNAANIAEYFGLIGSFGLIVSLFNGCGRPVVGAIVDRFGRFRSMFIMIVLLIVASLMLIYADRSGHYAFMFVGIILVGVIYGGGNTISTKVICEMYGARHFGVNHSVANLCIVIGALIGPYLSGILQDRSNGGFSSTFVMLLFMGLVELVLVLLLIGVSGWEEKHSHK